MIKAMVYLMVYRPVISDNQVPTNIRSSVRKFIRSKSSRLLNQQATRPTRLDSLPLRRSFPRFARLARLASTRSPRFLGFCDEGI